MHKKILFLTFFLLLIINPNVKATSYYSDYGTYSDYTNTYSENNDIQKCEVERRYHWYQETKEGNYYLLDHNDSKYPIVDLNDFKKTEYTGWQEDVPANIPQRETFMRYVYETKKMKDIRYIYITNVRGNFDYFRITELQIYYHNQRINYTYECNGCNSNFDSHINNNDVTENMSYLTNGGSLKIDLQGYYDASDIIIKLSLFDVGPTNMNYTIKYTREDTPNSPVYWEKTFSESVICDGLDSIELKEKNINNLNLVNPEWDEVITYLSPQEATPTRVVTVKKQYQYRDTYFYYYNLIKNYVNGYYVTYNNYLKDTNQYQDYYRCQIRDKVTLEDNIVITNYDQTLKDFIYENTTNTYNILGNIDLYKNNTYHITYEFPFINLERDVIVNNPANDIDALLNQINTLNNELNNVRNSLNEQIQINNNNLNIINTLNQEKEALLNNISLINSQLQNTERELNHLIINQINNEQLINQLTQTKNELENNLLLLNNKLISLKEELSLLINDNNAYLETINNLVSDKNNLTNKINNLFLTIEELENNDAVNVTIINELLDNKTTLENNMNNLNSTLTNQLEINKQNTVVIDTLNQEINTLENKLINQDNLLSQIEIYRNSINKLNNTIIKQNKNLKDTINLKIEEANDFENEIKRLTLLLSNKENELIKLQNEDKENVNPVTSISKSGFSFDLINIIIFLLITAFIILLKIIIKKNVELK